MLTRGALAQLEMVMLTRSRMQEVLDDAVSRGRVTRDDANDLVGTLFSRGRRSTEDILSDVDQLLGRGRDQIETAASDAGRRARRAAPADRVIREVDRARRVAGIGTFPILGYDDLTAAQVETRLTDLTPAQMRKVRDYERRNANRKSVLAAVERKL